MRVTCKFCSRVYQTDDGNCPGCGAYNQPPAEPPKPPPQYAPPTVPPGRKSTRAWIPILAVALMGAMLIIGLPTRGGERASDQPDAPVSVDIEALILQVEQEPANHQLVVQLVQQLYAYSREEAHTTAMLLFSRDVREPEAFRAAGEVMEAQEDTGYACRMYFSAYVLSGDPVDLERATSCAAPGEIITAGPTTQALEFLFQKQMRQITWEEIGRVRYFSVHSDYIDVSLEDPAQLEEDAFGDSVVRVKFDSDDTVSFSFLYGLGTLEIYANVDTGNLSLFGLRELRALTISSVRDLPDLTKFADIPHLEQLYIGGTGLRSLEGLDGLPNLDTLSLTGTSIDNLSILSTYQNIRRLYLSNNKELTGLSSLEYMSHLQTLSVNRQDVLDFQFLQKLYNLEELALIDTGIKDFYFLSRMDTLRSLTLHGNDDLKSIAGIGALQNLTELDVHCNKMEGISEIASLGGLTWLKLRTPTDLGMLQGLGELETLVISGAGLLDSIAPVGNLGRLRSFTIISSAGSTHYFSLEPLTRLPQLTRVDLQGGQFLGDSAHLLRIAGLEYLDLTGAQLAVDAAGFSGLTGIKTLKVNGLKPVRNVSVYSDGFFTSIDYDKVDNDAMAATLSGLGQLRRLEYAGAALSGISFVQGLPAIEYLELAENYITDIALLGDCQSLRYVDLAGNPVRDWAPSETWTHVQVERR